MASLTGQLVAETYKALLKLIDNDILTASEKQITDGFGGGSNVFIDSQGFLRANKYKVTNGLATQFLKADGSLDSNAYLTSITGAQVITALGYTPVPTTRTITINGETHNLAADNSWTVGGTAAIWGNITGTLSNQTDLQNALNAKYNNPTGTISQYIRGDGSIANFPALTGYVPYSGATSNVNLGEYGITSGFVGFDTTPTGTPTGIGTLYWDSANRTLSLIDGDGDTTLQIGQEERVLVHNNTGATLTDGQIVYVTGSTGELPSVALASNSAEATSSVTFGMVTESIAHGADGFITTSGIVHGLNTLAFTEGAALWLGTTPGTFTQTKPVAPLNSVLVGYVIKKAGGNGSVFVKIQNGYELEELHDVYIADPANNHGLFYDIADGLWKNKSIATALGYTPQAQLSGTGFVKASGTTITYDNSTYLTTTDAASTYQRLDKMVSNLLPSATEYPNSNAVIAALALKADAANPVFTGNMTISGAEPKLYFTDTDQNPDYFIGVDAGFFRVYDQTAGATRFVINSDGNISTGVGKSITAGSFIKDGGTATQFLKADGSVDATDYATVASLANYLLSTTAASTYQRLDKMVSNLLPSDTEYPNSNAVINALALKADALNPVFTGNMTISGATPRLYFVDTDQNPDYTVFVDSGFFYIYDQTAGATRFSINSSGNINTGVGKTITTSGLIVDKVSGVSTITFPAGTNDPGFIQHIESTANTGIMRFSVGDDNDSNDYFAFGNTNVPDAFRINAMGTVSIGVWQATAITDTYISSAATWNAKQNAITLTTTGSSGAATFTSNTLNIPNYGSALSGYLPLTGGTLTGTLNGTIVNTSSYGRFYNVGVGGAASGTYAAYSDAVIGFANLHLVASTGGAVYVNSALALPFYINPVGGNVLIGTTTDSGYKFDVNGTGRFIGALTSDALYISASDARIRNNDASGRLVIGNSVTNTYGIFYGSTHPTVPNVIFFANNSSPTLTLNSNNTATFSSSITATNGLFNFTKSGTGVESQNLLNLRLFGTNAIGDKLNIRFQTNSGQEIALISGILGADNVAYGSIGFTARNYWTDSMVEVMRITNRGDVCIGSTSSPYNSPNRGSLFVNGASNSLIGWGVAGSAKGYLYHEGTNVYLENSVSGGAFNIVQVGAGSIVFTNNGADRMQITSSGTIIARNSGQFRIERGGNYRVNSNADGLIGYLIRSGSWKGNSEDNLALATDGPYGISFFTNGTGTERFHLTSGGNIIIGNGTTDNGTARLQVNGGILSLTDLSYSAGYALYPRNASVNDWWLGRYVNSGTEQIQNCIGQSGTNNWRLGYYNPSNGSYNTTTIITALGAATFSSSVTATSFFESSDIRLKTLIESNPIIDGIENLQAKLYEKNGKIELGYFAQDAELIMAYAVTKNADGFLNLSYREVHTAKIARLEQRVAELEKQLNLN